MRNRSTLAAVALAVLVAGATPALARPGGWGGPGWGNDGWGNDRWGGLSAPRGRIQRDRSNEGRVKVDRFVAEGQAAEALGKGAIVVSSQTAGQDYVPQDNRAAYEAAVIDQLVHAGYDTATPTPQGGQLAELKVTRTELQPAEEKRSPVSGSAAMSVGTYGSSYGLAVNVDMTKPLPPLVSTRLEARIRDRATNAVLWEGHAEVATREGDDKWTEQTIASKLAQALFDGFPRASDNVKLGG